MDKTYTKYINAFKFRLFERRILKATWSKHEAILLWAEKMVKHFSKNDVIKETTSMQDPIVKKAFELRGQVIEHFKDKYTNHAIRILIHVPSQKSSPGGYSLFKNLVDSLNFIGIETRMIMVGEPIETVLDSFHPTVLLSSDHSDYTGTLSWNAIKHYKTQFPLSVGLTASIEAYGNTPLEQRLKWAKRVGIDFYYSFRSHEYLSERVDYKPFFDFGYKIISIEFGANVLAYYPIANIEKDLEYVFLASSNSDKRKRYFDWLPKIVYNYHGFIDGPGWHLISRWAPQETHKFLYARGKIGINLHIDDSIEWASELNERTYILAACGIPQLVDNAKLLSKRFSEESFFCAQTPKEYAHLFEYMLGHPEECQKRALQALDEVYAKHTTFHRAEGFILQLRTLKENNEC